VYRMPCTKPPSNFSTPMAMDLLGKPHCNKDYLTLCRVTFVENKWVNFFSTWMSCIFPLGCLAFFQRFCRFRIPLLSKTTIHGTRRVAEWAESIKGFGSCQFGSDGNKYGPQKNVYFTRRFNVLINIWVKFVKNFFIF
jgi:hypothetical protein